MIRIEQQLDEEIEWRIFELAMLKTNHLSRSISENRANIIRKYSVIAIYALFEGYVVRVFDIYKENINKLNLKCSEINTKILTSYVNYKHKLTNGKSDVIKQEQFILNLQEIILSTSLNIDMKINTESNVNMKVLNKLLFSFNLKSINDNELESRLNKLLKFRNSLAHGETVLRVTNELVCEFVETVTILMDLVSEIIVIGYKDRTYLR